MQTFKTADDAIASLERDGFTRDDYDPLFPYTVCWGENDAMRAAVRYDHNREYYYLEGLRL